MSKLLPTTVRSCSECPYRSSEYSYNGIEIDGKLKTYVDICNLQPDLEAKLFNKFKIIHNILVIQEWCPLKDV